MDVTAPRAARKPLAAQAEHRARLRARRHPHLDRRVQHRNLDLGAQRRLGERQRQIDGQDVPLARGLAAVERVRAHAHDDVEVAGLATPPPGRAFARQPLRRPADRSGRDAHDVAALAVDQARAFADGAARARHLAGPAAAHALAPGGQKPGLLADDPLAVTARAGDQTGGRALGARPEAGPAILGALEGDRLLAPQRRVLEVDLQRVAHVAPGGLAPAGQAEEVTEERVEELGCRRDVGAAQRTGAVDRAEPIVVRPLLLVGQHGVRDGELFELLLGGRVAGVAIRVPAQRQLAVGRLDLDFRRVPVDPQPLVVVGRQPSPRTVWTARSTPTPSPGAVAARRSCSPFAARRRRCRPARRRARRARSPRGRAGRTAAPRPRTV